jgi:hypothetical protein
MRSGSSVEFCPLPAISSASLLLISANNWGYILGTPGAQARFFIDGKDGKSDGREGKIQQNFFSAFHLGYHLHSPYANCRPSSLDSNFSNVQFHRESDSFHFTLR